MSFWLALVWGSVVLTSIYGWGLLGFYLLGHLPTNPSAKLGSDLTSDAKLLEKLKVLNWPQLFAAPLGVALLVLVGGFLNLAGIISVQLNLALVLTGLAVLALRFRYFLANYRFQFLGVLGLFALLSLRYFFHSINAHDDYHGYFNLPLQMLANGGIKYMGFNERALFTFGGGEYIQSIFMMSFDPIMLYQTEALGGALLAANFIGRSPGKRDIGVFLVISVFLILSPHPSSNSIPVLLAAAMVLPLLITLASPRRLYRYTDLIVLGLLAGTLVTFKTSCFPFVLVLFAMKFLGLLVDLRNYRSYLISFSAILGVFFLCLLPWMIFSKYEYGTLFFPYLGRGFHLSAYAHHVLQAWDFSVYPIPRRLPAILNMSTDRHCDVVILLFTLCAIGGLKKFNGRTWSELFPPALVLVLIPILITKFSLIFITGLGTPRYTYAFDLAFMLFYFLYLLNNPKVNTRQIGLLGLATCLGWIALPAQIDFFEVPFSLNPINSARSEKKDYYTQAQSKIPAGEAIFVFAEAPLSLDYERNKIFVSDAGISMSLPPGLGHVQSSEDFVAYFRGLGIYYLIYSKNEGNYSFEKFNYLLKSVDLTMRQYTEHAFQLVGFLEALKKDYTFFENEHLLVFKL